MSNPSRPELIPLPYNPEWPPIERSLGGKTANINSQFDWVKHRCQLWGGLICEVPNLQWNSSAFIAGRLNPCRGDYHGIFDELDLESYASMCSNVSTVGTNGGPSAYGTYDQNGNANEWVDAGTALVAATNPAAEIIGVGSGFSTPRRFYGLLLTINSSTLNLNVYEHWIGQINVRQSPIGTVSAPPPIPKVWDVVDENGLPLNYFDLINNDGLIPFRLKIVGDEDVTNHKCFIYFFCAENHRFPGSIVVREFNYKWEFVRSLPLAKRTTNDSPNSSFARTIFDMYDFEVGSNGYTSDITLFFNPPDTFDRFGTTTARNIEIVKRFKRFDIQPKDLTNLAVDDITVRSAVAAAVAGGGYDTGAIPSDSDLKKTIVINPLPTSAYPNDNRVGYFDDIGPDDTSWARPLAGIAPVPLGYGFRIATKNNPYNYPNFVTVGDLNNEPHETTGLGSVDYEYQIGKFLVTTDEYAEFLNIVGPDPGLYDARMAYGPTAPFLPGDVDLFTFRNNGIIYSKRYGRFMPNEGYSGKPVYWVSYYSAMRYCNWFHHGKPKNIFTQSLIDNGAYRISGSALVGYRGNRPAQGGFLKIETFSAAKTPNAKYYIPTMDEWYKAAYYKGNSQ
jgi:hypothetical protein